MKPPPPDILAYVLKTVQDLAAKAARKAGQQQCAIAQPLGDPCGSSATMRRRSDVRNGFFPC
jgi:hypothetical protein